MNNKTLLIICYFISSCSINNTDIIAPKIEQALDSQYVLNDFKILSSNKYQGRKTNTKGSSLAQQFLIVQLQQYNALPFKGVYSHQFPIQSKGLVGHNIVSLVSGYGYTKKTIVISAHYDHLGINSNQRVFNGADDNASGTAAVLSLAKQIVLNPLRNDVIFLFTDAEELNLLGAKAFLRDLGEDRENIILNINLDMLAGSSEQDKLFMINNNLSKILTVDHLTGLQMLQRTMKPLVLSNFNRARGNNFNNRINWRKASDHSAFNHYQIPYIYFGVGTHKNYHTVDDTFENANTQLYVNNVQNIYKQLIYIDNFLR